jgi:superfamily II DNA/RNA helicase
MFRKNFGNNSGRRGGGSSASSFSRFSGGRSSGPSFRGRFSSGRGGRGGFKGGGMRSEHIDTSRFINKVSISEDTVHFKPEHAFNDFKIVEPLKKAISARGFVTPTPIQDRAIPHILNGVDVVGIANTGTGKTGAFLIPLINKVLLNNREMALIIVPTRELALQIDTELQALVKGMRIFSVCCVGGMHIGKQIKDLHYEHNFVVGTPGRLKDLIDRRMIKLSEFKTVVLDEADRMLDMGFVNDMRFVMNGMPKDRHTLFFSATISGAIEGLIKEFLRDPVRISVKTGDTSKNVEQDVIRVGESQNNELSTL